MENKQLDIENIINNLSFVFAKTMKSNPHYYTVRTKDNEDFSCGYGEHLLNFRSFIASDINENCLGYLKNNVENP